jgi:predicted PurR-regulated permease PerM
MVRTVLTVAAVGVLLTALWVAREALIVIYISALIAMGFSPLVRVIQRPRGRQDRGVPRVLAILSIYLTVIGIFTLIGLVVVPPLIDQATTLWDRMPQHFNELQRILIRYRLMTRPVTIQEAVQNAPAGGGNAVATVFLALTSVMGGLLGVITTIILSFYFLIEGESLLRYATEFLPKRQRAHLVAAAAASVAKVSAWLRGQLILAGMMGSVAALGLGLLGVPYFYVVALIAAVGEAIPIVGPIIAGATAVAIALSVSVRLAIIVGIFFFILHQLEANVLVPKIMEQRVGVSPAAVLVALLIGAALLGVVGAILAIPTAAILSVMIGEFYDVNADEGEVGAGGAF